MDTIGVIGRVCFVSICAARVTAEGEETLCFYGKGLDAPGRKNGACIGDAVRVERHADRYVIEEILPRKSELIRRSTKIGKEREQVVAANVDVALIVTSANAEFNLSRLERYLSLVAGSGAQAVVALNKCDLCADASAYLAEIPRGVPVYPVSAETGAGVDRLREALSGKTCALIGSSGVGKSSLINRLAEGAAIARTGAIRQSDGRGRHTTSDRSLYTLPCGITVIDTPGMRAMALWDEEGIDEAFEDVAAFARQCRFSDCRHEEEPGCAVRQAVQDGLLDARRVKNYIQLSRQKRVARRPH